MTAPESLHETVRACAGCGQTILIGGYIDDLPNPYRCLECRPEKAEASELRDRIDKARQAQAAR